MGYNHLILIAVFAVLVAVPTAVYAGNHQGGGNPCQGNPVPDPITVLNAELTDSKVVRIDFVQSLCSTEFRVERATNGGAFTLLVNIDRTFDIETFLPQYQNPVTFYLDSATTAGDHYDYQILAKTQTREATNYSPIVSVDIPLNQQSRTMTSTGLVVQSNQITPITIDYIEGSVPLQNLLWEYFLDFDLISLLIQWVFASHGMDLWTSDPDPQNQAQLFFIEPTPAPIPNQLCHDYVEIVYKNDQAGGQTINFTATLLDYPTVIHQETWNSGMANRNHVKGFELTQAESALITDYTNIYVQINAEGESGLPPPNDRSLIIHEITYFVPEDQGSC